MTSPLPRLAKRLAVLAAALLLLDCGQAAERKTKNLILITLDGVRYQELFGGLDLEILKATTSDEKPEDTQTYKRFWADMPKARREKLMPFFWGEWMRRHGSVAGNPQKGSSVRLANRLHFSYPGYSEILTGQARDDLIKSNDKVLNPNPTALEFLRRKLDLPQKQVAAFASWDVIGVAVQHEAGAVFTNAGYEAYAHPDPAIQSM
ncbi:MAG: phosphoglyceromutase, partial [Verrucomicrobiota bacterium]|nr:phosphoglyceromutase [Verrucomicrobiota bacterium]